MKYRIAFSLLLVIALLSLAVWAQAETATLTWDEPTTNDDACTACSPAPIGKGCATPCIVHGNTPLTDLKEHWVYRNGVKEATVPATKLTGGGTIKYTLTVPDPTPGTLRTDSFYVVAVDTANPPNVSAPSNTVTKTFDKVAPGQDVLTLDLTVNKNGVPLGTATITLNAK